MFQTIFKNLHNQIDFFFRKNIRFSRKIKGDIKNPETGDISEVLGQCLRVEGDNIKILDIDSKNWFYVQELYNFFKYSNHERYIHLDGIEIDAFRVYADLHSRYDYALRYSKGLKNCRYIAGDFLKHNEKYDYITWFYPFLTEKPLLAWGLPLNTLRPLEMLEHALASLNPGGIIIIRNQNKKEYQIQEKLFQQLNIPYKKEPKCLITTSQNIY